MKDHSLNIVINNAGIGFLNSTSSVPEQIVQTNKVNFTGTLNVCEAFQPLMAADGVIVNVASQMGMIVWKGLNHKKQEELKQIDTTEALSTLLQNFESETRKGHVAKGFGHAEAYGFSKLAVIRMSEIQAATYPQAVYSVCPGWCQTELGGFVGPPLTSEEGSDGLVWLALGGQLPSEKKEPHSLIAGGFYQARKRTNFYNKH
eukprot:Trichotokara_eunicae@DN3662_c0_g1_i1.p1